MAAPYGVPARTPPPTKLPAGPFTQSVTPLSRSTVQRLRPNFKGEPVAGITQGHWTDEGAWVKGGLPYYTDAYTLHHFAGPAGQESTQWNAATAAKAKRMQIANYGRPGYIARSMIPGGLNQSDTSTSNAILNAANAASMVLPGGGVGELAGVLGFGLKGLRVVRTAKDVAEAAPPAAHATEEAAQLRGAMSGKSARTALKEMGPHERAGALLDDPNLGKSTKQVRKEQEAGYSVERGKRVAAASTYLDDQSLPWEQRLRLAKRELRGELPKINFQGFSELNDQSLQVLATHILNHPNVSRFEKIRATDALVNALAGNKVPTHSEITLLEHIFGKDTANGLALLAVHPYRDRILSALNVPRSLMASFDLSAPFRQGLMISTRHPTIFARNFGSMIKAFGSEGVYHGMLDEIRARPTYPLMLEARLPITELGRDVGAREERFASDYAEKLTGGKYGPVRASGRAYTGFLDKVRADVFDHLIERAQAQKVNVHDQHFLESLGRYIGSATGRGDLGHFQEAGKYLNAVLFSPRLLASRLNFLNPVYYARLHPFARREALRSALQLAGTLSTMLGLASQVPGVRVQTDPRNPDWGKIRIGNTRMDIAGGFQQELRLLAQVATGVAISSTTGKRLSLTAGGFGKPTRLDLIQRFFMGKESPLASLVTDWLRGSTQIGQKFSWRSAAAQRMTPLLGQDAYDLYKEKHGGMNGLMAAFAGYGLGAFGLGLQTYGPKKPTSYGGSSSSNPFSSSGGGGGNPFSTSGSGSGNPFSP